MNGEKKRRKVTCAAARTHHMHQIAQYASEPRRADKTVQQLRNETEKKKQEEEEEEGQLSGKSIDFQALAKREGRICRRRQVD